GQLMSATALLSATPHPTPEQAQMAMTGNICRCSNYNHYVAATVAAGARAFQASDPNAAAPRSAESLALRMSSATSPVSALTTVGHETSRIDAAERVSGKAKYTADVSLPGMLYARVLRSPHPHARVRAIDLSKARALPGVKAIVTHENCDVVWGAGSISGGAQYNDEVKKITKHRRYAFNNPVRFVGEPAAAVAAVDRHGPEEALQLITVDYETLPFVLDPEEALKPDAVEIWPEGYLSPTARNEFQPIGQKRGSVDEGFKGSDKVFEE